MRWLVSSSVKFRRLVLAAAVGLMVVGVVQLREAPVAALPEFAPPTVEVRTEALGLSAEEVEQLVTVPLEADLLNGVAFLDEIRSTSMPGLSEVELIFEPGTDLLTARQVVAERLTGALGLPQVSKPPEMLQPLSSTNRVMTVGLSSQKLSLIELSVLSRWTLRPKLMGVPGVSNVSVFGQRERQIQVQIDPERLRAQNVSVVDVMETTGNALWVSPLSFVEASTPGLGGFIDTPNQRLSVQHISPILGAKELREVPVEDTAGPVRLSDVATVVEDHQPLIGDAVNNEQPSLTLMIEKFPNASTKEVTGDIEEALAELKAGLPDVSFQTGYRPANFMESAISNIGWLVLIGLVLLAALLLLLLFDWRAALVSVVAVPLSIMAAAYVLYLRDATFNLLLLAGLVIAVAAVVDDAIIDVDTIKRRLRRRREEGSTESAASVVVRSSMERRIPALYATLILILVAVPVLVVGGVTGKFTQPMMISYILALVASMVVALTVTPALASVLLSRAPLQRHASPVTGWLQRGYDAALKPVVRRPVVAVAAAVILAVVGLATVPGLLDNRTLPPLRERDLLVQWDGPPGTSHPEMARITTQASRQIDAVPGVSDVGVHVGRAIGSDRIADVDSSELWVTIDPDADYDGTVEAVRRVVGGYPGLFTEVGTYPEQRVAEVQSGTSDDLVVRVYGKDTDVLQQEAKKVAQAIGQVDGVGTPRVTADEEQPTVEVEVDLQAAQREGIKPGDVRRAAAALLSGIDVGQLFDSQKVFDVVVWGAPEIRQSLTSVQELMIDKPDGGQVRLEDVADVRVAGNPTVIERESVEAYTDVVAPVDGNLGAVQDEVASKLRNLSFPYEYHAKVVSGASGLAPTENLWGYIVAAAVGVLLLLQALLGSWRLAALLFVTLPVALAGGAVAAWIGVGTLSLVALAGLFAVFAIVLRNTLALVRHYQQMESEDGGDGRAGLVLAGSRDRFVPVLLTACATAAVLVPSLFIGDVPGLEVVRPVTIVVLGGLVTTTIYTLFIVPSLYLRVAPRAPGVVTAEGVPEQRGTDHDQPTGVRRGEHHAE